MTKASVVWRRYISSHGVKLLFTGVFQSVMIIIYRILTSDRVFIMHELPSFLEQISPSEAVEYVLPLLSGLAMDPGGYPGPRSVD
jgi:hypothetical protein